jgi:hypothetical protein
MPDDYERIASVIHEITSVRDALTASASECTNDAVLPLRINLLNDVLDQLDAFQGSDEDFWQFIHRVPDSRR